MATRLAILGVDAVQHEWLAAIETLRAAGDIEFVAACHRTAALAKDAAVAIGGSAPAFDDVRLLMKETAPRVIVMDRPETVSAEFLQSCFAQGVGILSLGPPVENVAEAMAFAEVLEPQTHLLYVWPRMADARAYRRCAQAEDFIKPIRFAAATWMGRNHALARIKETDGGIAVRSLSVLAWDALATLIELLGVPASVYASIRGTVTGSDRFSDISGAAALTLRFAGEAAGGADDGVASVTMSDRMADAKGAQRHLLLMGAGGTVKLQAEGAGAYEFRDAEGKLVDAGGGDERTESDALATLKEFLQHFSQPASPARGWEHRLVEVAATMEAMVVSHRTGQAESPDKFRRLRR